LTRLAAFVSIRRKEHAIRTLQTIAALAAILASTLLASAHEFWVRPGQFTATQGELGRFYLFHGHQFEGEFVPRNEPYVARFELLAADGSQSIMGRHGQSTNVARFATPGTNVVVYESREVLSELGPERFAAYLQEKGLDDVARQREQLGETDEPGLEMYVRCTKALVSVAAEGETAPTGLTDRVVGLPLEIVLEPMETAAVGQTAKVRVLYDGTPLARTRLAVVSEAQMKADATNTTIIHTDADGYASFELDQPGPWMVTALHMVRTIDRDDADWKSYWASLTFAVPARDDAAAATPTG
jgi:uncharacterized GH25 family protein